MSVPEDARILLSELDANFQGFCMLCCGSDSGPNTPLEHKPTCVWLRRDRIIAALEAAEVLCHHILIEEVWPARQALSRIMLGDEEVVPQDDALTGTTRSA